MKFIAKQNIQKWWKSKLLNIVKLLQERKTWWFFAGFVGVVIVLTFLDQWSKTLLTQWPEDWEEFAQRTNWNQPIVGVQKKKPIIQWLGLYSVSLGNPSTTFFVALNLKAPTWLTHFNSILVMLVVSGWLLHNRKIKTMLICALIFAGALGNTIDRIMFKGVVRDIFTFSWHQNGVWNLADAYIVLAIFSIFFVTFTRLIMLGVVLLWKGWKKYKKNANLD